METLPDTATSVAVTDAVHSTAETHAVTRPVAPISIVEPGPGLDGVKPLPSTRSVKPWAAPAYTLEGCSVRMLAPVEIVTFARPDCDVSSLLMATTWSASGDGGAAGAVYIPNGSTLPQVPAVEHAAPCTCQTT